MGVADTSAGIAVCPQQVFTTSPAGRGIVRLGGGAVPRSTHASSAAKASR
jgi:hypothetical protein